MSRFGGGDCGGVRIPDTGCYEAVTAGLVLSEKGGFHGVRNPDTWRRCERFERTQLRSERKRQRFERTRERFKGRSGPLRTHGRPSRTESATFRNVRTHAASVPDCVRDGARCHPDVKKYVRNVLACVSGAPPADSSVRPDDSRARAIVPNDRSCVRGAQTIGTCPEIEHSSVGPDLSNVLAII